jgi:hypothetical protein
MNNLFIAVLFINIIPVEMHRYIQFSFVVFYVKYTI